MTWGQIDALDPCRCGYRTLSRIEMGHHYGYPSCCIEFYIQRSLLVDLGQPIPNDTSRLDGSGFICCPTHDRDDEESLLRLIQSARQCPEPMARVDLVDLRMDGLLGGTE